MVSVSSGVSSSAASISTTIWSYGLSSLSDSMIQSRQCQDVPLATVQGVLVSCPVAVCQISIQCRSPLLAVGGIIEQPIDDGFVSSRIGSEGLLKLTDVIRRSEPGQIE